MSVVEVVGLTLVAGLLVYLCLAMLFPERFA
jgi:K+-transporting ATPase KdpF subunit